MLLAKKGSAQPAHTDHKLTAQAFDPEQVASDAVREHQVIETDNNDHSLLVEAVEEINKVTRRQYNNAVKTAAEEDKEKVQVQEKVIVKKPAKIEKTITPPVKRVATKNKRIAMTLRMEHDNHLKLRLFAAHSRKSCQEIISEALENYLCKDEKVCGLSDCNCLNNDKNNS